MPLYLLMYLKVKIDPKSLPTMATYHTVQVSEPTLIKIADSNGGVLKFPGVTATMTWVSEEEYFKLERLAESEYNKDSKPQSSVVTANDLLKAIAITKDASLAMQLIKE